MAETLPSTIAAKIEFFEQRITVWAADPTAIGLTALQIGDLSTLTQSARTMYTSAKTARQQSRDATSLQNDSLASMLDLGTTLIAAIKVHAELSDDPATVFAEANVNMPSSNPSPLPAPVPATALATSLLNSGAVELSWKGTIANGTYYDIWRQLEGETVFGLIGSSSTKKFVDEAVPAGTIRASYFTITQRDGQSSEESESVNIRFGVMAPPETGSGLSIAA